MARTRRILTRSGDQFESFGEEWEDDRTPDFTDGYHVVDLTEDAGHPSHGFTMDFGGPAAVAKIAIWPNGFISLGEPTQSQIDWVAAHDSGDSIFGFPGDLIAAGVQDVSSVQFAFGRIDFEEPYNQAGATPILRIGWTDANFNTLQIQLTPGDFAIVDARVSDPSADPGQVGFKIGGDIFNGLIDRMADYYSSESLRGAFTGDQFANSLIGSARDDLILAAGGNDVLNGRGGADEMRGGQGDDRYFVDDLGDLVFEAIGQGFDRVNSSVHFKLGQNSEQLFLIGSGNINGTGNDRANRIVGNGGNNRIDGMGDADRMEGRLGNDSYVVDDALDRVIEAGGAGTDRVQAFVHHRLAANVEQLQLAGNAAIKGYGNDLANLITGNDATNRIDGGAGADTLQGRGGNDTYYVDDALDRVIELAGGGGDKVISTVSYQIGGGVERLELAGAAAIDGKGGAIANQLYGNAAANGLQGLGGNDQLYGRGGNDVLEGGSGRDRFYFDTPLDAASNVDQLADFAAGLDRIVLDGAVFAGIAAGPLAASAFHVGDAAADAADRIVYNDVTGEIFYDADGSGAGAAMLFARVDPGTELTQTDFTVA
ncbi:MAG TPA: calcium-binding protein [Allosphingosinicella sp.]|nr:calcium-binding protein [Allosphingosinicella sp.]